MKHVTRRTNSLLLKLTLAFLLVAVTSAALVALFIHLTSVDRFSQLITSQQAAWLQTWLGNYYAQNIAQGELEQVVEARMQQVFDNLISNALRYTPENGVIHISARAENRKIVLCVRDNGSGISEEELPLIFNRFYRVDKSRTDAGESGLGLAIAKALVEAHKGSIKVESCLNEYTTFSIQLPMAA